MPRKTRVEASGTFSFPQPLTEKYRPMKVADFIGLPKPKRILLNFLKNPFPSYWMFVGGSGLGKTTLCQALARELDAQLHEIPSAECDLERVQRETTSCRYGAFNFDSGGGRYWHLLAVHEANFMTVSAQRSFLSKLDSTDAPPQTIIIFTCNSLLNLEAQFLSRCTQIKFDSDSMEGELEQHLEKIYKKEGGKYPLNFADIAKSVNYNVRDAINKLQSELLLGNDRDGLPEEELKIIESHDHFCKAPNHHKRWKCNNPNCDLPYRSVCPDCGGAKTVGSLRAKKAIETMRRNAILKHEEGKKKR